MVKRLEIITISISIIALMISGFALAGTWKSNDIGISASRPILEVESSINYDEGQMKIDIINLGGSIAKIDWIALFNSSGKPTNIGEEYYSSVFPNKNKEYSLSVSEELENTNYWLVISYSNEYGSYDYTKKILVNTLIFGTTEKKVILTGIQDYSDVLE